ncbi:hypothetical protein ACFIJ5_04160 [Haloimpatiens sp. FM7330]|uniref:hypothetical protein n=1 Tax=Haloimpatiens sp. FM7330 TaxID=3298610 RepID=UPI00364517C1
MNTAIWILKLVAFAAVVLVVYNVLKLFVLNKIKLKYNWIPLVAAIGILLVQMFLRINPNSFVGMYVFPAIFGILFLWFMDLKGLFRGSSVNNDTHKGKYVSPYDKKNKKKDVIKPKAKANKAMKKSDKSKK